MIRIMLIDSAKSQGVVGQRKDWEGQYVQGQPWTVVVGLN